MPDPYDVAGFGGMVVDRIRKAGRIVGGEEKTEILSESSHAGGVVTNHLSWGAALGLRTCAVGWGGDDAEGRWLRDEMRRLGVDPSPVRPCEDPTSVSEIFVDSSGARAIYMKAGAARRATASDIRAHWGDLLRAARSVSSEICQVRLEAVEAALALARDAGHPAFLDFDLPAAQAIGEAGLGTREQVEAVLRRATVVKGAALAVREWTGLDDPLAGVRSLLERYAPHGMKWVVSTLGERGCVAAGEGFAGAVPALPGIHAVDTTGAGDAFLGGLIAAWHRGLNLQQAAILASACGAVCCEAEGGVATEGALARLRVLYRGPGLPGAAPSRNSSAREASDLPHARRALSAASLSVDSLATALSEGGPLRAPFERAVGKIAACLERGGRLHLGGVGKPAFAARKAAATLSSLGIPSYFLSPLDALHGDSGQVSASDVAVLVSHSGRTAEIVQLAKHLRLRGVWTLAVTGTPGSPLASQSDETLVYAIPEEGDPLNRAPMASTLAAQAVLDAIAAELAGRRGIDAKRFLALHPAGTLGEGKA
ncbi:MAG: SIS domain-containing protein [Planctomycetes bacterium]|nr:SIS domain-containing protein [Planctomycetota bacterium]